MKPVCTCMHACVHAYTYTKYMRYVMQCVQELVKSPTKMCVHVCRKRKKRGEKNEKTPLFCIRVFCMWLTKLPCICIPVVYAYACMYSCRDMCENLLWLLAWTV